MLSTVNLWPKISLDVQIWQYNKIKPTKEEIFYPIVKAQSNIITHKQSRCIQVLGPRDAGDSCVGEGQLLIYTALTAN